MLAAAVLTAVCGLTLWSVAPVALGWKAHVIMSNSMEPTVSPGDVVLTAPAGATEVKPGYVVVFRPEGAAASTTHRVLQVFDDGSLRTKGDANPTADTAPVPPEAVTGVARLLVPAVGLPMYWAAEQRWLLLGGVGLALGAAVVAVSLPVEQPGGRSDRPTGPRRRTAARSGSTGAAVR